MDSVNPQSLFIPKNEFDWEYYIQKNPDVKKIGTNLDKCYRHWITYGCYENRWVKSTKLQKECQVKLKTTDKFIIPVIQTYSTVVKPHAPIDLKFKIAVMIHIFDVRLLRGFILYLNALNDSYINTNFDIYFNIVEENNPYQGDLKKFVNDQLTLIHNPNIQCHYSLNCGGDIGGFLLLSKMVIKSGIKYKYVIFVHSKNKTNWRIGLCQCIFGIKFENLNKTPDIGIISAKKWINLFDPIKHPEEYRKFKFHLIELCRIYELPSDTPWSFVAGTMFLADIKIIEYIVSHEVDNVYHMLNRIDSVDINWVSILDEKGKDRKGAPNDYFYRLKYGRTLISDYMIEHAFERIIGLICDHLNLKLIGQ